MSKSRRFRERIELSCIHISFKLGDPGVSIEIGKPFAELDHLRAGKISDLLLNFVKLAHTITSAQQYALAIRGFPLGETMMFSLLFEAF